MPSTGCHPERSEAKSKDPVGVALKIAHRDPSTSLGMTALEFIAGDLRAFSNRVFDRIDDVRICAAAAKIAAHPLANFVVALHVPFFNRSEERRVGKEA